MKRIRLTILLVLLTTAITGRFALAQGTEAEPKPEPNATAEIEEHAAPGEMRAIDIPAEVEETNELEPITDVEPPVNLPDWLPGWLGETAFLLPYYQWLGLALVIFLGLVADRLARFLLDRLVIGWIKLARLDVDMKLEREIWKPIGLLATALTWYGGMILIGLPVQVLAVLLVAVRLFTIVAGIWTAFRLIDFLSHFLLRKAEGTDTRFDDLLVPLFSRTLKIVSACIGLLMLAEMMHLPIKGLLGGLGIGGLALAFAAKDTLANLFGSVTVLVDRPFEIGDWIKTDKIEGTVEAVGMRSTRVRTFYNSLITVPNSLLITAVVDNMGRRRYRRIKSMLGLQYDTSPEQIDAFCEGVRELIRRHPYTRKDYYHVYFNQFSESSLDVLLYCFIECPDWAVELRERHRLFLDIMKLADGLGVAFAFPTRTLHMQRQDASDTQPMPLELGEPTTAGRRLASGIAGPPLAPEDRPGSVEYLGPSEDFEPPESPAEEDAE